MVAIREWAAAPAAVVTDDKRNDPVCQRRLRPHRTGKAISEDSMQPDYSVKLSLMRALLGRVTRALRAVCVAKKGEQGLVLRAIFDGEISERDEEELLDAHAELIADHPEYDGGHELELVRHDAPAPLNAQRIGAWVFVRAERDASTPSDELRSDRSRMQSSTADGSDPAEKADGRIRAARLVALQRALLGHIVSGIQSVLLRETAGDTFSLVCICDDSSNAVTQDHMREVCRLLSEEFSVRSVRVDFIERSGAAEVPGLEDGAREVFSRCDPEGLPELLAERKGDA